MTPEQQTGPCQWEPCLEYGKRSRMSLHSLRFTSRVTFCSLFNSKSLLPKLLTQFSLFLQSCRLSSYPVLIYIPLPHLRLWAWQRILDNMVSGALILRSVLVVLYDLWSNSIPKNEDIVIWLKVMKRLLHISPSQIESFPTHTSYIWIGSMPFLKLCCFILQKTKNTKLLVWPNLFALSLCNP